MSRILFFRLFSRVSISDTLLYLLLFTVRNLTMLTVCIRENILEGKSYSITMYAINLAPSLVLHLVYSNVRE